MIGFVVRRTAQALVVIIFVSIGVFLLAKLIPGGECHAVLKDRATPANCKMFNHETGLDRPLWVQYWHYFLGLLHGHVGHSYFFNEDASLVIASRLPKTIILVGTATVLALLVAIPLGILQVVKRNTPVDYALTGATFTLYAMPTFLLGTILIVVFAIDLQWFPTTEPTTSGTWTLFTDPRAFVLPVITLAAVTIASFSRYMRSSMMETMTEDYVRTARAKGASERRVLYGHALRNALIPILTLVGLSLPNIAGGALITETVFNYPGMGLLTVNSALQDDVATVLGCTLVITVATVIGSLLADILYAVADPRIRLTGGSV